VGCRIWMPTAAALSWYICGLDWIAAQRDL
jgi:hypothetical protein